MGEAAGEEVILTPELSIGGVVASVRGAAYTGISLKMSPELSVGDVGSAAVGERLAPGLSVGGVGGHEMHINASSARLPPELSIGAANGRVVRIFSSISRRVGVLVDRLTCRAAAAAHVTFEGDAFSPSE